VAVLMCRVTRLTYPSVIYGLLNGIKAEKTETVLNISWGWSNPCANFFKL